MDHIIFHIDVNSAFLSWSAIELLKANPTLDLRLVPSIIGGDKEKRHGIVLAKSIPAKKFNIQTGEPIVNALRKCPSLTVESPNFHYYNHYSHLLMNYLSSICPDIEQVSIDECYMDFTPIRHLYSSPLEAANFIKDSVFDRFGFTVNIGISDRKILAKMASDFKKPNLVHTLFQSEIKEKMWILPVSELYMCGKSSVEILRKLEILTIGDLANADSSILASHLKSHGPLLKNYANGMDDSFVTTKPSEIKGVGNSTTLPKDVLTREEAFLTLLHLAESVSSRLRSSCRYASMVSLEIKYSSFQSLSHQTQLAAPSYGTKLIYETACHLFDELWNGDPIRLLGIRTSKLVKESEPQQLNLFDLKKDTKNQQLDSAIDSIRQKFGAGSIVRGSLLQKEPLHKDQEEEHS